MARKRDIPKDIPKDKARKPKAKKKPAQQASSGNLLKLLMTTPMRQVIMVIVIVALLAVFWGEIQDTFQALRDIFGWGVLIIFAAVVTIVTLTWRRKLGTFIHHWNRWLGGIVFLLAVWGILAAINYPKDDLFSNGLGGSFGRDLIDFPNYNVVYAAYILAMIIVGIVFIAPRASYNAVVRFFTWLSEEFKRKPAPPPVKVEEQAPPHRVIHTRPAADEKPPLPSIMEEPVIAP